MGPDAMILVFWMLSFKPTLFLSSFIKRFFSSSSLSAISMVSSAYLRLLIFLPAILSPAYASSSLAFRMMYSAYKLNTQGDDIQPWCTTIPIWNQSVVTCPVLTGFLTCVQLSQEVFDPYFTTIKNEMKNKLSSDICYNMDEPTLKMSC